MMTAVVQRLCTWYRSCRRELPWRANRDPYRIWVSEIMLQQTRAAAVIPYYRRFLEKLPGVRELADCPEDELMKLWEGLGYYSRARHMRETARIIRDRYGGIFPSDPEALQALPGIGRYTAGAVASIAYGVPVAAVDGNVLRIFSRLTCSREDILRDKVKRETEKCLTAAICEVMEMAENASVSQECARTDADCSGETGGGEAAADKNAAGLEQAGTFPGDVNQGFMDLGATVCLPHTQPLCGQCPLSDICGAHLSGKEMDYPVRRQQRHRRMEDRTVLLITDGSRVALRRRPEKGLLAGLYEYPCAEGHLTQKQALRETESYGFDPVRILPLPSAVHIFTHLEWHMTGYEIRVSPFRESREDDGLFLADIADAEKTYAVPSAYRTYSEILTTRTVKKDDPETGSKVGKEA